MLLQHLKKKVYSTLKLARDFCTAYSSRVVHARPWILSAVFGDGNLESKRYCVIVE